MALYLGEEEVYKCLKHPSKRRRNGVCPTCLRDRLCALCPECANLLPCSCSTFATSSSSSSFSLFSSFSHSSRTTAPEDSSTFGRVGNLIESEPKFQRSRSVAVPLMKPRFSTSGRDNVVEDDSASDHLFKRRSFWSFFKNVKTRNGETEHGNNDDDDDSNIGDSKRMMLKSRSMRDVKGSLKGKSWYFPSPIKVFRQRSKVVQDRSPLQR